MLAPGPLANNPCFSTAASHSASNGILALKKRHIAAASNQLSPVAGILRHGMPAGLSQAANAVAAVRNESHLQSIDSGIASRGNGLPTTVCHSDSFVYPPLHTKASKSPHVTRCMSIHTSAFRSLRWRGDAFVRLSLPIQYFPRGSRQRVVWTICKFWRNTSDSVVQHRHPAGAVDGIAPPHRG
jgi:hypothetical protein